MCVCGGGGGLDKIKGHEEADRENIVFQNILTVIYSRKRIVSFPSRVKLRRRDTTALFITVWIMRT